MEVSIDNWKSKGGLLLESAALGAVRDLDNSLVMAGPGVGKTELLAQKASFLLETNSCRYPQKILAISFKKDAASNLKERITRRLSKKMESRFISQTFDSFAKGILDRFLNALPEEYRPTKNYIINTHDKELADYIERNGFSIHKNNINEITTNKFEELDESYKDIWRILLGSNETESILTFSMITRLVIHILDTNPYILEALRKTYSHVFIDEFQDTTSLQYELITTCFYKSNTSITAVGDMKQRIMLWAGAKPDIFTVFKDEFEPNTYELLMNHRSAPRLLEIQKTINNYIQDRPFTPTPNPKWDSEQGQAENWYFQDSINEAELIAKKIQELVGEHGINFNDICIIVRQTTYKFSDEIIPVFEENNIKARDESKFQDLLTEEIIILVINTLKSSMEVRDSDAWQFIWDAKIKLEGKIHTENISIIDRLRIELKSILNKVRESLNYIETTEHLYELISKILKFYDLEKIKNNYPQYSQGDYAERLIEDLADYLFEYYNSTDNWLEAIDSFEGKNSVPIMTIHKSKGLEYEAVFFVGLDDTNFWNFTNSEQEEKYNFYVGLSRAKQFLYFTFSENRFGGRHKINDISILYEILEKSKVVEEHFIGIDYF